MKRRPLWIASGRVLAGSVRLRVGAQWGGDSMTVTATTKSAGAVIRPLIAGNWKMNGLSAAMGEVEAVAAALDSGQGGALSGVAADVMIAPPVTLLMLLAQRQNDRGGVGGGRLQLAAQDCHAATKGAHTGDISAEMLADAGAMAVIVGHSERRADHGETSATVRVKAAAAHRAGLMAIICVGETIGERDGELTLAVVKRQLAASLPESCTAKTTAVAYEPVWAIGTGLTPTLQDVATVHAAIRADLVARFGAEGDAMRILYGGSVKPDNAAALMSVGDVNGALVGGASLKASDFIAIIGAYKAG